MTYQNQTVKRPAKSLYLQRGASLLEGLAYLGVAAVVILGAVSLLNSALNGAQSNRSVEELTALRTGVKKLYGGQGYTGISEDSVWDAGLIPGTLKPTTTGTTTALTNSWGGAVTITSAAASEFSISYASVPKDACVSMISGATGWTKIKVGSAADITTFPVTAADAISKCAGATNSVVLTAA